MLLIEAFVKANNIGIIYLSVAFLDSETSLDDERLYTKVHSIIRADYPSNTKRGRVGLYCKEYLLFTRKIGICKLNECVVTKITVNNERYFSTRLYRSLSHKIKSSLSPFTKTC